MDPRRRHKRSYKLGTRAQGEKNVSTISLGIFSHEDKLLVVFEAKIVFREKLFSQKFDEDFHFLSVGWLVSERLIRVQIKLHTVTRVHQCRL